MLTVKEKGGDALGVSVLVDGDVHGCTVGQNVDSHKRALFFYFYRKKEGLLIAAMCGKKYIKVSVCGKLL